MTDILPRTDFRSLEDDAAIHLAGSEAEQRRLSLLAWEAMEVWGPPGEEAWARISADWMAQHRWRVGLGGGIIPHTALSIERAIRALGHESILVTQVDGRLLGPSAVWRLPVDVVDMDHVRQGHFGGAVLFFTEARDFLIHCDGDEATAYAGPRNFVQTALQSWLESDARNAKIRPAKSPQDLAGSVLDGMRQTLSHSERGRLYASGFEQHYRPFLL